MKQRYSFNTCHNVPELDHNWPDYDSVLAYYDMSVSNLSLDAGIHTVLNVGNKITVLSHLINVYEFSATTETFL